MLQLAMTEDLIASCLMSNSQTAWGLHNGVYSHVWLVVYTVDRDSPFARGTVFRL